MKKINYRFIAYPERGADGVYDASVICADADLEEKCAAAHAEAYGEVTVEDIPDPPTEPTQLDRVEAQATYTAMLTDTLLEV